MRKDRIVIRTRELLSRVVRHVKPITRWPCHECDRPSSDSPLRLVRRITEDGNEYRTGCFLCNFDDLLKEIELELHP